MSGRIAWWQVHLGRPLAAGLVLFGLVRWFDVDAWLAGQLFRLEGGAWQLRGDWLFRTVLHDGARRMLIVAWGLMLVAFCLGRLLRWRAQVRRALGYLCLVLPLGPLTANLIKPVSASVCPWDLAAYGGAYATAAEALAAGAHGCFPAAHASGGYAYLALFFAVPASRPGWRIAGLAFGLALGAVLGLGQQLRGAHFLSHDLAALLLCWTIAVLVAGWRATAPTASGYLASPFREASVSKASGRCSV